MTQYSVQPRDCGFCKKGYGFLSSAENLGKNIGKDISKNLKKVNIVEKLLIMLNNLQQIHSKLLQKDSFKNQWKQLAI